LIEPMPTGDGLLARLRPLRAPLPCDGLASLCAAARRHGNGVIEITGRGNLQVRGLRPETKDAFAADVMRLGIDMAAGVPITTSPLSDPDVGRMVDELRQVLTDSALDAALGPKVSVVVDGGGPLHLDAVAADVRLRYLVGASGPCFHVAVGHDGSLGTIAFAQGVQAVERLVAVIAARAPSVRARDIVGHEGVSAFRDALSDILVDTASPPERGPAEALATHPMPDGTIALGVAPPFGHADAVAMEALAIEAKRAGAIGVSPAPGRVLLAIGLDREQGARLAVAAERLGFIVRADDPRRHIAACAGAPHCASAELATRILAPSIAQSAACLLDGSLTLHLSGCPKGCAHGGDAALTVVGQPGGGAGLVIGGSAKDAPADVIEAGALPAALAGIARRVVHARRPGERAADVLARLGARQAKEAAHG